MRHFALTTILLLGLLGGIQPVYAHDPGLSTAELHIDGDLVSAHFVFARTDIELLFTPYRDQEKSLDDEQLGRDMGRLVTTARGILFHADGKTITGSLRSLELDSSDAVHVYLDFPLPSAREYVVSVPLLNLLARGHRQYLTVRDRQGTFRKEVLLSRSTMDFTFTAQTVAGGSGHAFFLFLKEGVHHIWVGYDHLAFLFLILLPAAWRHRHTPQAQKALRNAFSETFQIVTAFTVAHSVTLALATLQILVLPSRLVEIAIAASVVAAGLLNLNGRFHGWKIAFAFGLIHGFGFAGALRELGVGTGSFLAELAGFNLGVELGQVVVVLALMPLLLVLGRLPAYNRIIVPASSLILTGFASLWLMKLIYG